MIRHLTYWDKHFWDTRTEEWWTKWVPHLERPFSEQAKGPRVTPSQTSRKTPSTMSVATARLLPVATPTFEDNRICDNYQIKLFSKWCFWLWRLSNCNLTICLCNLIHTLPVYSGQRPDMMGNLLHISRWVDVTSHFNLKTFEMWEKFDFYQKLQIPIAY